MRGLCSPLFTQERLDAYLIDFAKSLFKGFKLKRMKI